MVDNFRCALLYNSILQEVSLFKLSSLQHQLSESVPKAVLEKANQEYNELVIKYQQCLQKETAYAADSAAMERLQVLGNLEASLSLL